MENLAAHKKTVLLADDEYHILEMLGDMLEISGFKCLKALDGKEALELFRQYHQEIDLYLFDILMPKMSGIELYHKISSEKPDLKIIFLSGYTEKKEIKKFLTDNKLPYLNKPFRFEQLLDKIKSLE